MREVREEMLPELYNNQKAIRVVKAESNADHPYSIFNYAALQKALSLPPVAFKIWAYLNAHQNEYEFGLSSLDVRKVCRNSGSKKLPKKTYDAAIQALIEAGYLVQVELYPNLVGYLFFEQGFCGKENE